MVRIYFVLFIVSSLALLSSCEKGADKITSDRTESRSYEFTENGCATGKQSFSSNGEMCAALQNDALNKGCAPNLRERYFKAQCPGQTFKPENPTPPPPVTPPEPALPVEPPAPVNPVVPPAPVTLYPHDTNIVFVRRSNPDLKVCDRIVNRAPLSEMARGLMINSVKEGGADDSALDYYRKLAKRDIAIKVELQEIKKVADPSIFYIEIGVGVQPLIPFKILGFDISGEEAALRKIQSLLQSETKELVLTDDEECAAANPDLNLVREIQSDGLRWSGQFGYADRILLPDAKIQYYSYENQKCSVVRELTLKDLSSKMDRELPVGKIRVGYQTVGTHAIMLDFYQNKDSRFTYVDGLILHDFQTDEVNRVEKAINILSDSGRVLKITDAKECEDLKQPEGPFYFRRYGADIPNP